MRGLLAWMLLILAACGPMLPTPECDTNPAFAGVALTCDAAVKAAVAALPADHLPIERIQFLYGSATPFGHRRILAEGEEPSILGYVVFSYQGTSEREYVQTVLWHDTLTVESPAPY